MKTRIAKTALTLLFFLAAAAVAAAPVNWMPNFPMRLGAAGAMGMWMPVPGATEYKVLRQVGDGPWEEVFKGAVNNFQDPTAPGDQDVSYKVVAFAGGAEAGESPVVKLAGEKPIEPPTDLSHRVDAAQKAVHLRWNASNGASFYNVYKSTSAKDPGALASSATDTKFTDAVGIEDGKSYWYSVTAVSATSKESKRAAPYQVDVVFPKVVVVKKFEVKQRPMEFVNSVSGEDFAAFKNPSDIVFLGGKLYVACEDGIQVVDADGNYQGRLPLVQEMVATGKWTRPYFLGISAAGNLFVTHVNVNYIHEITPDGTTMVREIVVPNLPDYPGQSAPNHLDEAPDGSLWVSDSTYGNLAILPKGANTPGAGQVTRLGWAKGKGMYDKDKDGLALVGPTLVRYVQSVDAMAVLEATKGQITFFDWKKKEKLYTVGGIGGALNQFSLCGDFKAFDDGSILAVDSLNNHVKRLKIAKDPKDETLGDYLESFVDDTTEATTTKLVSPVGGVTKLWYEPKAKRLYALSSMGNEVVIYDVP